MEDLCSTRGDWALVAALAGCRGARPIAAPGPMRQILAIVASSFQTASDQRPPVGTPCVMLLGER